MSKILYLSSTNSSIHRSNNGLDFTVELNETLSKSYKVCMLEIFWENNESIDLPIVVMCDIVESSFLNSDRLPILRVVHSQGEFQNLVYVNSSRSIIQRITISIRHLDFSVPLPNIGQVFLTLKLTPI